MTCDIIESEKEGGNHERVQIPSKSILQNGTKEQRMWIETTKDAKEKAKKCRAEANVTKVTLYRIDQTIDF